MLNPCQQQIAKALARRQNAPNKHHDFVLQEISDRLLARLAYLKLIPERILIISPNFQYDLKQLTHCYGSHIEIICCDITQTFTLPLPYAAKSFDLVFANMWLPTLLDYPAYWTEVIRLLKPQGILLFSGLGMDTLKELRRSFESIGKDYAINAFPDMHDIGDSLMQAGFSDPVIDRETLTFTYPNLKALLKELKGLGSTKLLADYQHLYYVKAFWSQLETVYRQQFADRTEQARLPVTVELYYGIAFAPTNIKTATEVSISIQSIGRRK